LEGNYERLDTSNPPKGGSFDNINHPEHYCSHPSKIECIDVVEHKSIFGGMDLKEETINQ